MFEVKVEFKVEVGDHMQIIVSPASVLSVAMISKFMVDIVP